MTNKTKTFEPTIPFDSVLAKAILESYYTGQCFENGGGDWVPDEFLDSELNVSNASLAAVNFHHRLLKHHGCFMELNPGDSSELPHYRGGNKIHWSLSWRGFELLESFGKRSEN